MEKTKGNLALKAALVCSGLACMIDMVIYPAADFIYTTYATANIVLLNFIITGPSMMIVIGSLLCGLLAQKVGKKQILAYSYILFCVATIFAGIVDNVYYLFTMRAIAGLCAGFITAAGPALIVELFTDERDSSRMMGFYSAVMCVFGSIMSFAAGYLAVVNWHLVFMVYLLAVPVMIIIILFVPKTQPEGARVKEAADDGQQITQETVRWSRPFALAGAAFSLNLVYSVIMTMIAVYFAEEGIGDASSAGTSNTVITIGSFITSLLFSTIYMRLKRRTPVVCYVIMGLGFVVFSLSHSLLALYAAAFFMGGMYGLSYNYYLIHAAAVVPESKSSISISLATAAVYLGFFFGPYVCPVIEAIFRVPTMGACMPFLAGACFIYTIISIVLCIYHSKRSVA